MNVFDDFLNSIKADATLNSFIAALGFDKHNLYYYNNTLAETSVDDLRMIFYVDDFGTSASFTVYDNNYKVVDRALFKLVDNNEWKEIEDD